MRTTPPLRVLIAERRNYNLNSQSVYVRVVEPMSWLKDKGLVDYAIISEFDQYATSMLNWANVIIFNKHSSDESYRLALHAKEKKKKIIYDIDDNIFNVPENLTVFSRKHHESLRIIELADTVVVENDRLLKAMHRIHTRLTVISNGLFTDKYKPGNLKEHIRSACLFSTYVPSLNKFIRTFVRVLHDFQFTHPHIRFDLYGNNAMDFPFDRIIPPCGYSDYMKSIIASQSLMGIVPIWGSEDAVSIAYRDCKSPIKYIMYGYAGIPAIYTNALPYTTCVVNGENGLLVDNTYESWIEAMAHMAGDSKLRQNLRRNAYDDVCANFHISKSAMAYYDVLTE